MIDKRITSCFIVHERADLWLGLMIVAVDTVATVAFCAAALSLSNAYALNDTLRINHSPHWRATDAPKFYLASCGLIAGSAALVLLPNAPLGLITLSVQTLAGVLLPLTALFPLLCNDREVFELLVNGCGTNLLQVTSLRLWCCASVC